MRRLPVSILLVLSLIVPACSSQPHYPSPPVSDRDAVIDVSTLKDEVPQFYTYQFQGKNISFFVLKLKDRTSSFFDACVSCYPHKLGYQYEKGGVVCRACNTRFSVYTLEKGLGSCYPLKLEGRVEGGKYRIALSAIEAEAGKF